MILNKSLLYSNFIKYYDNKFAEYMLKSLKDLKNTITEEAYEPEERKKIIDFINTHENKYKKSKQSQNNYNIQESDLEYYIQTILVNINDIDYYQDEEGYLYSTNDDNEIMGKIINDSEINWFN
jgi:hypothetical protein